MDDGSALMPGRNISCILLQMLHIYELSFLTLGNKWPYLSHPLCHITSVNTHKGPSTMFKDTGKHPGFGAESKLLVQLNKLDWTDLKTWDGLSLLTSYKGGPLLWLKPGRIMMVSNNLAH